MPLPTLFLKPGREKSLLRRHPWIFSGAVASVRGEPGSGETVAVRSSGGDFLAWAAYSPHSQIRARVWTWDEGETVDEVFFRSRLMQAIAARQELVSPEVSNAVRLVYAESDGVPGLVADRYADTLVVQFLSAGAERWRGVLVHLLLELSGADRLYEHSDVDVRRLEGLPEAAGQLAGLEFTDPIEISEHGLRFLVDVRAGHKTGYYLDQRRNRLVVRGFASGRDVLDCFCYSGGFTINALAGEARSVLSVDSSGEALANLRANLALNNLPNDRAEQMEADVFQALRLFRDQGRSFDLIILDPPKFAHTASHAERAARGYKDINLLAFKLLRPGGILATFSCSGGVSEDLFQKIVAGAALDAGVDAQIIQRLHQDADHPVALNFPEGAYLKGLVIKIRG